MGAIRKTYNLVAALALVHLLAIGGGVGYLVATGKLDAERARAALAVLKGEGDSGGEATADATSDSESGAAERAARAGVSPDDQRVKDEVAWRNAERYRTQIEQRLKLINAARLDVDRRREEFEKLVERDKTEREARTKRESVAGYAKQVELISQLSPKVALKQIMAMSDVDAARILFDLNTRKVKKIVEAAKSENQQVKMTNVMKLLVDVKSDTKADPRKGT